MAEIAAQLTGPEPLNDAVDASYAIASEWSRGEMLITIAPRLTNAAKLNRALASARTITDNGHRARALAALATRVAERDRTGVLDEMLDAATAATGGTGAWDRVRALQMAAPYLKAPAQQNRAIDIALAIPGGEARAEALLAVAEHLTGPTTTNVLERAIAAAHTIRVGADRAKKLLAVAERLTEPARTNVVNQVLDSAVTAASEMDSATILAVVAKHLTQPVQFERALTAAHACANPGWCAAAVAAVAARLTEPNRTDELKWALDAAIAVPDERDRAWALYRVASHLSDPAQLDRALDAAFAITDADWVLAVVAVALKLAEAGQNRALRDALERVTADTMLPGPSERQISVLAQYLTEPAQLGRALDVALGLGPSYSSGSGAWVSIFRRVAELSTISPQEFAGLFRRATHALPARSVLFEIIGAAAPATARVGGQEALGEQLDLMIQRDSAPP